MSFIDSHSFSFKVAAIVFLVAVCSGEPKKEIGLQCQRCFQSSMKNTTLLNYTSEFLSQFDTNLVQDKDERCPTTLSDWSSSKYAEMCQGNQTFCGRRVFRITTLKYANQTRPQTAGSSTEYPILRPEGPDLHEYTFTLFSCIQPEIECNKKTYSNLKWNKTLVAEDGNPTLEFQAVLQDQTDCSQCRANLCNKETANINDTDDSPILSGSGIFRPMGWTSYLLSLSVLSGLLSILN